MVRLGCLIFVTCLWTQGSCFLDQNDVQVRLSLLENQTRYLKQDIEAKNDLTQILQANVVTLNGSLAAEQAKSAALETKVADLEKRLQNQIASSGELSGDVKSVKNLALTIKTDLASAQQDLQTGMASLLSLNQSTIQSFYSVNTRVDWVNSNLTMLEQTLALATNGKKVYFTYRNSESEIPTNPKANLKFHGRIANQGNSYNEATGEFIAPADGLYWFSLTLGTAADDFLNCYIVQNNQFYLVEVYTSAYSSFTSASSAATVFLPKGDTVSVSGCQGNGTLSSFKTSFSGMLVYED